MIKNRSEVNIVPEFRRKALSEKYSLLEKCIIYDGGARRFEIREHVDEVLEFWNGLSERGESIGYGALLCEKSGYERPISYEKWLKVCHYEKLAESVTRELYTLEQKALEAYDSQNLKDIAKARIHDFEIAMKKYIG